MGTSKSSAPKPVLPDNAVLAANLVTPAYWDEACKHLSKRDRVMRKLIADHGSAGLQSRGDAFTTLARSIVGQQISVKAAQAVWERLVVVLGGSAEAHREPLSPLTMLSKTNDELRQAGLSARKVEYLSLIHI